MFNYKRSHVVNNSWILINRKAKLHLYNEKEGHVITMYSFLLLLLIWVFGEFTRTSTNPIGPEINDHISLQGLSY
jgi:hypothetical protein